MEDVVNSETSSKGCIRECVQDANDGDQQLAIPRWTVAPGSEWLTCALLNRLTLHVQTLEIVMRG
jgi:hypothetical protein